MAGQTSTQSNEKQGEAQMGEGSFGFIGDSIDQSPPRAAPSVAQLGRHTHGEHDFRICVVAPAVSLCHAFYLAAVFSCLARSLAARASSSNALFVGRIEA